jgi:hypothetical protein
MKKTTPLITLLLFLTISYILAEKRHHIFLLFFILIFVILLIQIVSIPRYQKNILTVIIVIFYYRNIMMCVEMVNALLTIPFKYPPNKRKDNNIPKSIVNRIFNKYFYYSSNIDSIPKHKTIYVSNYVSDRFENFACIMIPNISIILGDTFVKTFKLHKIICNLIPRKPGKNQYDTIKKDIKTQYDSGFSIFAYIEEPSTVIGDGIGRLRSGMFSIAKELNITITPVVFDHIEYNKFGMIYNQNYRIKIGTPFHVQDVKDSNYKVRKFFRDTLKKFKRTKFENIY